MVKVIIDSDTGTDVDDALAIALAARSNELSLEAVTTVFGDTVLRARIAKKILNLTGRTGVPVAVGEANPITPTATARMRGHEGEGLLTEAEPLELEPLSAVDTIISRVLAAPGEITVIAVGALTNLAIAIRKEPALIKSIPRLMVMGGTIAPPIVGGVTLPPQTEYNLNCDPDAAVQVLGSGIPITLVPVNMTLQVCLSDQHLARIKAAGSPLADSLFELMTIWLDHLQRTRVARGWPPEMVRVWLHDPLTVALAIDPGFVRTADMCVKVEMRDGVLRTIRQSTGPSNMEVVVEVNAKRFADEFVSRILADK